MALSARDRKRRQLEREAEEKKRLPDSTYPYLGTSFHEYLSDDPQWNDVEFLIALTGMEPPVFEDDRGPKEFADEECFADEESLDEAFKGSEGSIGRAECMVGFLLDASIELARIINTYKKQELQKRLDEINARDLSDPEERRRTLDEAVHIARLQEELDKNVRRTIPQWSLKGV
ncbi:hypothetical protein C2I36_00425 [Rhodobacteraceae bacterium WD3A24]|nr:hypothetical protein C2I36_00425 [Rhodobacteraceae bacterium WD3A24]